MSLPMVCGIETEYGITVLGADEFNPVVSSSLLINSYADSVARRVRWDFEDESPGRDARGPTAADAKPPEIETHLVNVVLTNGARYYVDHAHPEYSSPEVMDPRQAALYDKAGELIVSRSVRAAQSHLEAGQRMIVYKNNSDGKGNSYGCHENYLLDRKLAFSKIVTHMLAFFATRQVICGAGKVGAEHGQAACDFQISQRADFFEEEVGLETTLKRPIVNTRDEPHADPGKYRRLHVIVGDANMSEVSTYLKVGITSLVLAMIEGSDPPELAVLNPVGAIHAVSHDPTCRKLLQLTDGTRATPVEIQWEYHDRVRKYLHEADIQLDAVYDDVLDRWESVLTALEADPMQLDGVLDWPTKLGLLESYRHKNELDWSSPRLKLIDLQYHDVDPRRSIAHKLMDSGRLERILGEAEIEEAAVTPPADTRAWFRGRCLERFPNSIVAANWDSIVFDVGEDSLRRVPMLEPRRGTKEIVGDLLESSESPEALLEALGQ